MATEKEQSEQGEEETRTTPLFQSEASRRRVHASLARRLPNCPPGFAWFSSEAPSRVVEVSGQRLVIGGCGANLTATAGMFEVALHNGCVLNARLGLTFRRFGSRLVSSLSNVSNLITNQDGP